MQLQSSVGTRMRCCCFMFYGPFKTIPYIYREWVVKAKVDDFSKKKQAKHAFFILPQHKLKTS